MAEEMPYTYQPYPKWFYHQTEEPVCLESPEGEAALSESGEWQEVPFEEE